jgi:hypothetical protein
MGFFRKLLGIKEKPVEEPVQEFPQPQGNLVGQCALCSLAIGESDNYMKMPKPEGAIAHKRCLRKAKKMAFSGISPEEMARRLAGNQQ